jgi:hypothetical protein
MKLASKAAAKAKSPAMGNALVVGKGPHAPSLHLVISLRELLFRLEGISQMA